MKVKCTITGLIEQCFRKGLPAIGILTMVGPALAVPDIVPPGTTITSNVNLTNSYIVEGAVIVSNSPSYALSVQTNGIYIVNEGTIGGNPSSGNIDAHNINNFELINSGAITTSTNNFAFTALNLYGTSAAVIENSGSIDYSHGYTINASHSDYLEINNTGTISSAHAMAFLGSSSSQLTMTNSGTISAPSDVTMDFSDSIGTTVSNSGTITTGSSRAITALRAEALLISNTGTISALSETFQLSGDANIVNFGTIEAVTANQNAIHIFSGDVAIRLEKGSTILGGITAGDGVTGTLTMNHGAGASYAYTTSGDFTLIDLNNRPVVSGSAISAGIGAQETADKLLFQRTTRLNDSFASRLNGDVISKTFWVTPYAAHLSRETDDATVEAAPFYSTDVGVTFGRSLPQPITVGGHSLDIDVVVNANSNHLDVDDENQTVRSSGVLAGLLAPRVAEYRGGTLSAKALAGYVKHRGDRAVITNTGSDLDVTADYHSLLAILGTEGRWSKALRGNLHGRLTAGVDLSAEAFASYSESQYFAWDERTLTQLSGHIDAVVTHHIPGNKTSIFGGLGVLSSRVLSGKTNNYQINQTNVSFSGGHMSDTYGRVQGGVNYQLSKVARMTANVDYTQSIYNINKLQGYIGVVVQGA
ncbi:MAG: autotransporter outer membrane beta-barrel domain-containing protein [Pseudomonadota bacterium]